MKKTTRIISAIMATACALSGFAACGGLGGGSSTSENKKPAGTTPDQTLEIFITNAGYGMEWLNESIDAFKQEEWVKTKYPNLYIPTPKSNSLSQPFEDLTNTEYVNDIVFACGAPGTFLGTKLKNGNSMFEDLTSLYNDTTIPGETQTMAEKMSDDVYKAQAVEMADGSVKYYGVPWVRGTMGIFYNQTKLDSLMGQTDYPTPRTTDEFIALAKTLSAKLGDTDAPFIFDIKGVYWDTPVTVWWAQYEGLEEYENYWYGISDGEYSSNIFKQQGRLEALKVEEALIGPNTATDSKGKPKNMNHIDGATGTFMQIQTKFMMGTAGVFMPNGDWLANEMKSVKTTQEIVLMKNPVVSSIINKCTSVKTDDQLKAVVDYVDQNKTYDEAKTAYKTATGADLTQADYEFIYSARNMKTRMSGHEAFIPSYSNAKGLAKDFLLFLASDKGLDVLMANGRGYVSAYDYEVSAEKLVTFSPIQKAHHQYIKTAVELPAYTSYKLSYYGGLKPWGQVMSTAVSFASQNAADRLSAQQIYDNVIKYYTDSDGAEFDLVLQKAGIKK